LSDLSGQPDPSPECRDREIEDKLIVTLIIEGELPITLGVTTAGIAERM
jgi:hypothetical protein